MLCGVWGLVKFISVNHPNWLHPCIPLGRKPEGNEEKTAKNTQSSLPGLRLCLNYRLDRDLVFHGWHDTRDEGTR